VRLSVVCGLAIASCSSVSPFEEARTWPTPTRGAVVSEHRLATAEGVRVLEAGGNAADAAVAMALTLAVVYPKAGNLGGGGFALWVPHEGQAATLDFREVTPHGIGADLYMDEAGEVVADRSLSTPLAVGVPGTPAGLFELYERFGSGNIRFSKLCARAIALANLGFEVDGWLADDLRRSSIRERLERDPAASQRYYPGGIPLSEGEVLRQPDLAATLALFARSGASGFYRGKVADDILAALTAADERCGLPTRGRGMDHADLEAYTVRFPAPVVGWMRGSQIISMGPPSSGGIALLQILSILDGFPLEAERDATLEQAELALDGASSSVGLSARAAHWWIEAMRIAFVNRAQHLGDPAFHTVPVDDLLSAGSIAQYRIGIGETADLDVAPLGPSPSIESTETTHLSVIDRDGNAVSLTTTLNAAFGSGILVPGAGFLLNNELDDFSISPGTPNQFGLVGGEANQLLPGKRPLSSMTPTVVRAGGQRTTMVLGAPGGPRIITAVAQTLLRVLVYGQSLMDAVAAPRLHQQWRPAVTAFEEGWPADMLEILEAEHGHALEVEEGASFGSIQAIWIGPDGQPIAVSDPRRGGRGGLEGDSSIPARGNTEPGQSPPHGRGRH
jgi:gamma-glutamyltranspeptidase/glutathione hydrolase